MAATRHIGTGLLWIMLVWGIGSAPAAGSTLDKLRLGKTVAGPDLSPREMRGKVVLVEFWWTDCAACIADTGWLNQWTKRFGGEGFHVVGIELHSGSQEKIREFVERFGVKYQVTLGGRLPGFDVRGTPFKVLLDRTGEVVAVNPESTALSELIPELMAEVPAVMVGEGRYEALADLAERIKEGERIGEAVSILREKEAKGTRREMQEAKQLLKSITEAVRLRMRRIDRLLEEDPERGLEKLGHLAEEFAGCAIGDKTKEAHRLKSADPEIQCEIDGNRAWKEIEEDLEKLRPNDDIRQFLQINRTKIRRIVRDCESLIEKWPDTKSAERARRKLREFSE